MKDLNYNFEDSRVECIKLCPFCLDIITVNHLGRNFNPEKNGMKDFCKLSYRVLNAKIKMQDMTIQKDYSSSVKIDITNDLRKQSCPEKETIDSSIRQSLLKRNIKILETLLYPDDIVSFDYDDLILFRYAFDVFDYEIENEEQLPMYKVGRFAVLIRKDEPCGLTWAINLDE